MTGVQTCALPIYTAATANANRVVTVAGGTLTVGGTVTGAFNVGDIIHATASITAGSTILANANTVGSGMTGLGGAGTYLVSVGDTAAAEEIDVYSGYETKWYAMSAGAAGELVKMSDHALG